jgi:glycosyltransferase involved in cell wall biosynthesis
VRICLAFDCLYPYTIGGGERWYRGLAERLAARGHDVTYLTLRQWDEAEDPDVPGVDVVAVARGSDLYTDGRRSISAQLRFANGVLSHLLRHGGRYDVVQTPGLHLALLAVLVARRLRSYRVVVDWFEVWRKGYWLEYLGPVAGRLGWFGQRLAARSRHSALCFSRLHADRLRALGHRGEITSIEGLRAIAEAAPGPAEAEPVVVFAGRHIPEKRVTAIAPAVALAREQLPELRAVIFGDGPDRGKVLGQIDALRLDGSVEAPGFAEADRVQETIRHSLCLLFPSAREGYGIVVVEASALGTPTVVVKGPDNAAAELVEDGVNGVVAVSAEPRELADAIVRVEEAGLTLRESTTGWFRKNRERLSLEHSADTIMALYASLRGVKDAGGT